MQDIKHFRHYYD